MNVLMHMIIWVGLAFFLGTIPGSFGSTLLLGAILGVLMAIFHQLTNIYQCLKKDKEAEKPLDE